MTDAPNGRGAAINGKVSLGNLLAIGAVLVSVTLAWGELKGAIGALAQRVDKSEQIDARTSETLSTVQQSIVRIETEQKAVRAESERIARQLDRIEQLLRGTRAGERAQP